MVGFSLETAVDEPLESGLLLLFKRGNFVPEDGLLERNERQLLIEFGGEEVLIFLNGGFVARHVALPVLNELGVEGRASRAIKERIHLRECEGYDFPLGLREIYGTGGGGQGLGIV